MTRGTSAPLLENVALIVNKILSSAPEKWEEQFKTLLAMPYGMAIIGLEYLFETPQFLSKFRSSDGAAKAKLAELLRDKMFVFRGEEFHALRRQIQRLLRVFEQLSAQLSLLFQQEQISIDPTSLKTLGGLLNQLADEARGVEGEACQQASLVQQYCLESLRNKLALFELHIEGYRCLITTTISQAQPPLLSAPEEPSIEQLKKKIEALTETLRRRQEEDSHTPRVIRFVRIDASWCDNPEGFNPEFRPQRPGEPEDITLENEERAQCIAKILKRYFALHPTSTWRQNIKVSLQARTPDLILQDVASGGKLCLGATLSLSTMLHMLQESAVGLTIISAQTPEENFEVTTLGGKRFIVGARDIEKSLVEARIRFIKKVERNGAIIYQCIFLDNTQRILTFYRIGASGIHDQSLRDAATDQPLLPYQGVGCENFSFIYTELAAGKTVVVHCLSGESRSSALVNGYLCNLYHVRIQRELCNMLAYTHSLRPEAKENLYEYNDEQRKFLCTSAHIDVPVDLAKKPSGGYGFCLKGLNKVRTFARRVWFMVTRCFSALADRVSVPAGVPPAASSVGRGVPAVGVGTPVASACSSVSANQQPQTYQFAATIVSESQIKQRLKPVKMIPWPTDASSRMEAIKCYFNTSKDQHPSCLVGKASYEADPYVVTFYLELFAAAVPDDRVLLTTGFLHKISKILCEPSSPYIKPIHKDAVVSHAMNIIFLCDLDVSKFGGIEMHKILIVAQFDVLFKMKPVTALFLLSELMKLPNFIEKLGKLPLHIRLRVQQLLSWGGYRYAESSLLPEFGQVEQSTASIRQGAIISAATSSGGTPSSSSVYPKISDRAAKELQTLSASYLRRIEVLTGQKHIVCIEAALSTPIFSKKSFECLSSTLRQDIFHILLELKQLKRCDIESLGEKQLADFRMSIKSYADKLVKLENEMQQDFICGDVPLSEFYNVLSIFANCRCNLEQSNLYIEEYTEQIRQRSLQVGMNKALSLFFRPIGDLAQAFAKANGVEAAGGDETRFLPHRLGMWT